MVHHTINSCTIAAITLQQAWYGNDEELSHHEYYCVVTSRTGCYCDLLLCGTYLATVTSLNISHRHTVQQITFTCYLYVIFFFTWAIKKQLSWNVYVIWMFLAFRIFNKYFFLVLLEMSLVILGNCNLCFRCAFNKREISHHRWVWTDDVFTQKIEIVMKPREVKPQSYLSDI